MENKETTMKTKWVWTERLILRTRHIWHIQKGLEVRFKVGSFIKTFSAKISGLAYNFDTLLVLNTCRSLSELAKLWNCKNNNWFFKKVSSFYSWMNSIIIRVNVYEFACKTSYVLLKLGLMFWSLITVFAIAICYIFRPYQPLHPNLCR